MGNTSSYLSKILRVLKDTEGDIEEVLNALWEEAKNEGREEGVEEGHRIGHDEGYDEGYKDGQSENAGS